MDLRNETYIVPEDIVATLQGMGVLEQRDGTQAVINKARVREWVKRHGVDLRPPVDREGFVELSVERWVEGGTGSGSEEEEEGEGSEG